MFHRWPIRRRVVVNLHDGRAFDGILIRRRGPLLVLADATLHDPTANGPTKVEGQVFIERPEVAWIQATHT